MNQDLLQKPTSAASGVLGITSRCPLAQLKEVHKRYGKTQALNGVSLDLYAGEFLALLGSNGAGKSTAISLLLGLRRPDKGEVRLMGCEPSLPSARLHIGATPQDTGFPGTLTVREVIEMVRSHYPAPLSLEQLTQLFDVKDILPRQTGGLSGGQRRKVSVALAFVGAPQAVFLDEPTTGLDVEARHRVWDAVRSYVARGGTVMLTTHYLEEAEALASRIVLIDKGRVAAEGSVRDIKAKVGLKQIRFQAASVPELPGVKMLERENGTWRLYSPDADEVVRALVRHKVPFEGLEVLPVSLEQAFLALTGGKE